MASEIVYTPKMYDLVKQICTKIKFEMSIPNQTNSISEKFEKSLQSPILLLLKFLSCVSLA